MYIKQISVFIENKKGHIAAITGVVSRGGINIKALSVFDSSEFGILRLVVDDPYKAVELLKEAGHVTRMVDVLAVEPNNKLGAMHEIFQILSDADINVEYVYSFVMRDQGLMPQIIIKTSDQERAAQILEDAGVAVIPKEDVQN
jgi:hypothetical protein